MGMPSLGFDASKVDRQKLVLLGLFILVCVAFYLLNHRFLSIPNLANLSKQVSFVIITGCAVTLLMISGHLDLSVGSVLALTGVLYAYLCSQGLGTYYAFVLATACGGVLGLINAFTVVQLKITSFIATLGMLYMARGLAYMITGGTPIRDGLADNFSFLGREYLGPFPIPFIIMVIVILIFVLIEKKHMLGKYSIAIGGNRTAAILSGINSDRIVTLLYVVVGISAGFSGALMASRLGVGEPNVGFGFEFDVIIAIILGGTSLAGGEGSILGMVLGALIVGSIDNGLNLLGVFTFFQAVVKGIDLVGAVLLNRKLSEMFKGT